MAKKKISILLFLTLVAAWPARPEVLLQWFETDWDEMYQKLPRVAEIGYDNFWIPPPTKGPTGKGVIWANVGYNLYDRFDIGDVPQRGTRETRYGTRGSLRNMVDNAHNLGIKIIPDIVMNHNGNGPDFREYPGMSVNDFHLEYSLGYANTLNFKRAPRMDQWTPNDGYGGTMWQDLANLIDIRTEDHPRVPDNKRFTGQKTIEGRTFNFIDGTSYVRHVGQYDRYPYAYTNENAAQLLDRWIVWLGNAMNYDGLRLDAGKHTPYEFFGWRGNGFLHEAQWNFAQRRGYSFGGDPKDLFANDIERTNAFIFAEILSPWSEIQYWYGTTSNDRNPMRFLDYAMKKSADSSFTGNLSGLGAFGTDFGPNNGILYVWGHDEALASGGKANLAYAYTLSHVGVPMVYYTGNNISWADYGRDPSKKTWMIPGYDSHALGEGGSGALVNMVWINQNFARGSEVKRFEGNGDFFALERYEDKNGNGSANSGEGIMVLALNDSGGDRTETLQTAFPSGTVLKDYTGNNGNQVTVNASGQATITVPGMSGQGWVVYAPLSADGLNISVRENGNPAGTMPWVIPGGVHASATTQQIARVTSDSVSVDVIASQIPAGLTVDNIMFRLGNGSQLPVTNYFDAGRGRVSGRFHNMNRVSATNYTLTFSTTNLAEGLHILRGRAFTQRDPAYSAIFNTASKVVYVDRRGPDLVLECPTNFNGDALLVIRNPDFTAYEVFVKIDGGAETKADMVMKGLFHYPLSGLTTGGHTVTVRATEFNYANPRAQINASTNTLAVNVSSKTLGSMALALVCPDKTPGDSTAELPFFKMVASGASASARLYWDNYELPFNAGAFTNNFNGEVVQRDNNGRVVTNRLWGNFINGAHTFVLRDGADTVVKRVVLNLYGNNHIDSDGDSLPDNVEMPFFDQGAPGPDVSWPGDSNNNFIPESWEVANWTRLNPYNHSTFYSTQWDDRNDKDGDGVNNYEEVYAGYLLSNNVYAFNIYDAASKPASIPTNTPSTASMAPNPATPGATITVTYTPNDSGLASSPLVYMHIGHSKRTLGSWQDVQDIAMTKAGASWTGSYLVPSNATSVDVTFRDGSMNWDGKDWQFLVSGSGGPNFIMDGQLDSSAYEIASFNGMKLWAAVRGSKLYVATWATGSGGNDHAIYVSDDLGDARPAMPTWNKQGYVFLSTTNKPFLAGEGDNSWAGWFNALGTTLVSNRNSGGSFNYLEGQIDLYDNFGGVPVALYLAVGAYQTTNNGLLTAQVPALWDGGENIDVTEILRVPVKSIRDENVDGYFDGGSPQMWTVVNSNTNDANYGLRRFFIDEVKGDQEEITVILQPNAGGTNQITAIEIFSNLNRRDYVKLPGDENPDTVTTTSLNTYYRGYTMTSIGGGRYSATIPVNRCGAYRINARYKINNGPWRYYTDNGLRRDCAVVVSPRKALDTVVYEFNPLTAEATSDNFFGRSTFRNMYLDDADRPNGISTNKLKQLGVNMIWLQPIHPIGTIGRQIDPSTSVEYDPGSPYAVKNYWQINAVLGDPSTPAQAMLEFTNFVSHYDTHGIGVMLDGTFNHSAWDAEIGEMAVTMGLTTPLGAPVNPTNRISAARPAWYSKKDSYGEPASFFTDMGNTDIATAPDRIDFGKWNDAADFFFGRYDALVQKPAANTNWTWSSSWHSRFLREEDLFEGFTSDYTRELWEYFAAYPLFWLEKTGHPAGTPKDQSWKGIDGLRCDFAQGLPSEFWEYTINKTRSVKWDFLYMAESLDGFRTVDGSPRHGVGYRSARHFDILNENILYMWRDTFFNYRTFSSQASVNANKTTAVIFNAFDSRKNAFELSPILSNLISHDEIFPTDDQWSLVYAYAINTALDGVPMIFFGQEVGAQNDFTEYGARSDFGIDGKNNNFGRYEMNFGKSIPHFKRYNHMTNIWDNTWSGEINGTYARVNKARLGSPALRSQQNYFLADRATTNWNPDIFAVAKFQQPGVSAATQDVVFAFINNNFRANQSRAASFSVNATTASGANWFGIQPGNLYNVVDIASKTPGQTLWPSNYPGSKIISEGIYVGFQSNATFFGGQVQYLRLLDMTAGMTTNSVNDMFTLEVRKPAPQIAPVSNRTVAVGSTLTFNIQLTKDPTDAVSVSAASTLAPTNWSFSGTNYVFSFTPGTNETGSHLFLFTATGQDGFDEELITVTVIPSNTAPADYVVWAGTVGLNPTNTNAGLSDDYDGDGLSNEQEYWADTSPVSSNALPEITGAFFADGVLNLQMEKGSTAPRTYMVQYATLVSGGALDWQNINTNNSTTGIFTAGNGGGAIILYRVVISPP